jgi:hypothetical protein
MKLYLNKVIKLIKSFFFIAPYGNIEVSNNNLAIPVIVVDLQTNKSVKHTSINQAARSLAAHPKTI